MKFEIGDVITSYHPGYHIVTRVDYDTSYYSQRTIYYQQIADGDGTQCLDGQEFSCEERHCAIVTHLKIKSMMEQERSILDKKHEQLEQLFKDFFIAS